MSRRIFRADEPERLLAGGIAGLRGTGAVLVEADSREDAAADPLAEPLEELVLSESGCAAA
jgi:hypothetical protein